MLYIGGLGRSGSTLVERLAGQLPGACAVGELVHLWAGASRRASGAAAASRSAVPVLAAGGQGGVRRLGPDRRRPRRRPPAPGWTGTGSSRAGRGGPVQPGRRPAAGRVHRRITPGCTPAIAEVSGCELVVDSSKHPSLAHCLRWQDDVDLRVLHLVRDSRAVAYSWGRAGPAAGHRPGELHDPVLPAVAAAQWNGQNAAFHLLRGVPGHAAEVRGLRRRAGGRPCAGSRRSPGCRPRPATRSWAVERRGALGGSGAPGTACRGTRCASPPAGSRSAGTSGGGPGCRRRSGGRSPR